MVTAFLASLYSRRRRGRNWAAARGWGPVGLRRRYAGCLMRCRRVCAAITSVDRPSRKAAVIRTTLVLVSLLAPMLALPTVATAKGCLKGAAVGGVAGHVAGHHGLIGAAAGCAVGRHQANAKDKAAAEKNAVAAAQPQSPAVPAATPPAK